MSKRGDNIRHRGDGRWEAKYIKEYRGGRAVYGYLYGHTYSEVKRKRDQLLVPGLQDTRTEPSAPSLQSISDQFLIRQASLVKPSTLARYRSILRVHLLPAFGNTTPAAITTEHLERFVLRLRTAASTPAVSKGLSEKTVRDIVTLLRAILSFAAERGWPSGVVGRVALPRSVRPTVTILSPADQSALEAYARANPSGETAGILLALFAGLRIGEVCALRWGDVDLARSQLTVRGTLQRIPCETGEKKTAVVMGTPKSERSGRTVPLPPFLSEWLLSLRAADSTWLLTGRETYLEPRVYSRKYGRHLAACGLPSYTFHALRHTFATRAVEQGFDTKTLSELLGHAGVKLTLERYVHPSAELKRAYMEKLQPLQSEWKREG